jgi:hypothetical protein
MACHSSQPQHPHCGRRSNSRHPSSATSPSSLLPVISTGIATQSSDTSVSSQHVPRFPLPVVTAPGSAENRNTHRPPSTARGFVPRGLSYAKRRPKLFTGAACPLWSARKVKAAIAIGLPFYRCDPLRSFPTLFDAPRKPPFAPVMAPVRPIAVIPTETSSSQNRTPSERGLSRAYSGCSVQKAGLRAHQSRIGFRP